MLLNRTLQLDVVIPAYEPVMNSGLRWLISRLKYRTIGYFSALLAGTFWVLLKVIFESPWRSLFLTYDLGFIVSQLLKLLDILLGNQDSHRTNTGLTSE